MDVCGGQGPRSPGGHRRKTPCPTGRTLSPLPRTQPGAVPRGCGRGGLCRERASLSLCVPGVSRPRPPAALAGAGRCWVGCRAVPQSSSSSPPKAPRPQAARCPQPWPLLWSPHPSVSCRGSCILPASSPPCVIFFKALHSHPAGTSSPGDLALLPLAVLSCGHAVDLVINCPAPSCWRLALSLHHPFPPVPDPQGPFPSPPPAVPHSFSPLSPTSLPLHAYMHTEYFCTKSASWLWF